MSSSNNIFRDGKVHVQRAMCPTCIFRQDWRSPVGQERVNEMVQSANEVNGTIICHETLDTDSNAACRGYFDNGNSIPLRLAAATGNIEWVREIWEHLP